jgi:ABC-type nitrate/sulfonate/bicarbonate transport system substrate-binding protein
VQNLHALAGRLFGVLAVGALVGAACMPGGGAPQASTGTATTPSRTLTGQARCDANKRAGKIVFLTGFGYFPSVSVMDVITAREKGYFAEMCLEVDIQPSIPGESMVLVSANTVQFAANSFGSITRGVVQGAQVKAVLNYGNSPIHVLIVTAESPVQKLADLKGKTIGSTGGTISAPNQAMLRTAGLIVERDYKQLAIGFDSRLITQPGVDAIEGFRSNQPDLLERAGIKHRMFFPEDVGIVASYGSIIASKEFLEKNPTASEDFVRAVKKGWDYALANTDEVIGISQKLTRGDFDLPHELFRWKTESELAVKSTPAGQPQGRVVKDVVAREVASLVQVGLVTQIPDVNALFDNSYFDAVHDKDGKVIWPGPIKQ